MSKSRRAKLLFQGMTVLFTLLATRTSQAMPSFSRQLGLECATCHTIVPRLNQFGYEFRRAGFRTPGDIGKERAAEKGRASETYNWGSYFDARIQSNLSYLRRNHATSTGGYASKGGTYSNNQIEFVEFTLYPLTGGFLKNWAAETEISGGTDNIEVENAYLRYDSGGEEAFWQARLGVFHPFEGYGASDRPIGLARPLIQTQVSVNAKGDKNGFHPWGFDETGAEGGISWKDTSLTLTVFNGLIEDAEDPAQGGKLKKATGSPTEKNKDFQIFFNQFIGKSEAAVSAYFYDGRISLTDTATSLLYKDTFRRYGVYGTLPISKLMLMGAYGWGRDKDAITDDRAENKGWFAEVDGYLDPKVGVGARYDRFDPSDKIDRNSAKTITAFANFPLQNGIQFITEIQNKKTQKGFDPVTSAANPDQTDNSANVRVIYIW